MGQLPDHERNQIVLFKPTRVVVRTGFGEVEHGVQRGARIRDVSEVCARARDHVRVDLVRLVLTVPAPFGGFGEGTREGVALHDFEVKVIVLEVEFASGRSRSTFEAAQDLGNEIRQLERRLRPDAVNHLRLGRNDCCSVDDQFRRIRVPDYGGTPHRWATTPRCR